MIFHRKNQVVVEKTIDAKPEEEIKTEPEPAKEPEPQPEPEKEPEPQPEPEKEPEPQPEPAPQTEEPKEELNASANQEQDAKPEEEEINNKPVTVRRNKKRN